MKGYGYSIDDPVRVSGFYGEKHYLESLRRAGSDEQVKYERLGSGRSDTTGHPVDIYKIKSAGPFKKAQTLYIDIYGEQDWRAPEGFTLCAPPPEPDEGGKTQSDMEALFGTIQKLQEELNL